MGEGEASVDHPTWQQDSAGGGGPPHVATGAAQRAAGQHKWAVTCMRPPELRAPTWVACIYVELLAPSLFAVP